MDEEYHYNRAPNYRAAANFLSAFTFWWTCKIFKLGKQRDLFETDLPGPLKEHEAGYLGKKIARLWSKEYARAKIRQTIPSLSKVLVQCFISEYLRFGMVLFFIELIVKPLQPIFLGLLVRYFTYENSLNKNPPNGITYFNRVLYYSYPNQSQVTIDEALVYAFGIVFCSLVAVSCQHPYMLAVMHLGMKVRVATTSLMYRKTLRMSMLALSPTTVGNIVNLMSNDATRFDIVMMFLHYLWISPTQFFIFIYFLYSLVGMSSLIGGAVIILFIPLQILLAYLNKLLRYKTALKTDERVRLMNEIICGIQVIKMYAWEFAFCKLVNKSRRREMNMLVLTSYIRGIVMSMIMFTARSATFVTLISIVLFYKQEINSELVFVVTGYYIILRSSITVFFPQGVTQFAETLITIKRTRDYLLTEEAIVGNKEILKPEPDPKKILYLRDPKDSSSFSEISVKVLIPSIRIIEAYARWHKKLILRDIELTIKNGELVVFIGQVGAGKSSLLQVILKELPLCQGFISTKGDISYATAEPWLFQGSVRQNIIFGHEFNRDRYRNVCRVCALLKDFQILPYGDQTVIGERGISLSGGQRARVNLARCIYKEADIYLLDDPLSAVDTHVGAEIFDKCINHFLKTKIRVLVTHQLQFLHNVDQLIIMENGRILAKGTYQELQSSGLDFAQYLEDEDGDKQSTAPQQIKELSQLSPLASASTVSLVTEFSTAGFYDEKERRESLQETRATGDIESKLYKLYFGAGGNWIVITFVAFMFVSTQAVASASDYFIGMWSKIEETQENEEMQGFGITTTLNSNQCIIGYSVVTFLLIVFSIVRSVIFFYVCLRASITLHDNMLESITFGRMRFFNNNPSGRILNRFSKDMGSVDEDLPYAMIDFFQMFLNLIGSFIVLSLTNFYLIPPIILVIVGIYFLRQYYLKTSRSLKRIEGVVRSYVYSHLNASIQGLTTIRSHEAEQILTYEFDKHMDLHSSAWYLFIATARALSIWTDLLCVTLIALSSFGFFFTQNVMGLQVMAGDVGLSITQCLILTGLIPWGMRQSAEMENHMTSVERIYDFINIEREGALRSEPAKQPRKTWPESGEINFENMELKYGLKEAPVLTHMNITIYAEEKIGIVGRTGAGKSSLIAALFRLAYHSGAIYIDDVNIFSIGLHELREKVSIIPQEPIIFTGTYRSNLDPFRQYTDATLLAALSIVELETNTRNILNQSLSEGGTNFSAGQKQLLCLARAIVRNNKILILDEATANMDPKTDKLIQTTIRSKFAKCTVLTIAHRLHTIMDSDRVLVMHAGTCVEFDHPHVLLQKEKGYFTDLVNQTGKATADFLKKIAANNYHNKADVQSFSEEEVF